ncbi:MAG: tRNA 2-thiouridine(34) synthase MnmA [Lentisphaeria bacterium]
MTQKNNMEKTRVGVAMSGGVDSSVTAALLKGKGYDVFGVTARTWPSDSRCCSDEDVQAARAAAANLGIEHFVIDLMVEFENEIVQYFAAEYARGRTPSPCAVCNPRIKFGTLLEKVLELGGSAMATGHYARIHRQENGTFKLLRGKDQKKDQSYFLFGLSQEQLSLTMFPLGDIPKSETRRLVTYLGLQKSLAERSESQDLCFVKSGEHWKLTEAYHPAVVGEGRFIDKSGRELGRHSGVHRYTVGQRRGLGISAPRPLYVAAIDSETGDITVAEREELMAEKMRVTDLNWICPETVKKSFSALVQIRYNHTPAPASVTLEGSDQALIVFAEPQFAVTPGQAAVIYAEDELLGGGWIV